MADVSTRTIGVSDCYTALEEHILARAQIGVSEVYYYLYRRGRPLNSVVCAVKAAESLVELGKTTSKHKTYRPPEKKPYAGIFAGFGSSRR